MSVSGAQFFVDPEDRTENVRKWLADQVPMGGPSPGTEEFDHIAEMLVRLCGAGFDGNPVGHFLTAVLDGDLYEVIARGDETNLKHLRTLVVFCYCCLPGGMINGRHRHEKGNAE